MTTLQLTRPMANWRTAVNTGITYMWSRLNRIDRHNERARNRIDRHNERARTWRVLEQIDRNNVQMNVKY
jgi:hypothetical protein